MSESGRSEENKPVSEQGQTSSICFILVSSSLVGGAALAVLVKTGSKGRQGKRKRESNDYNYRPGIVLCFLHIYYLNLIKKYVF